MDMNILIIIKKELKQKLYNYEYYIKEERERKIIKKIMNKQQHRTEMILYN